MCYWLDEASKSKGREPNEGFVPRIQEPYDDNYYQILQQGLGVKAGRERTLRIRAWWRHNDYFRHNLEVLSMPRLYSDEMKSLAQSSLDQWNAETAFSGQSRENLVALMGLLDETNDTDLLMKAEALRELGEFEQALQLLDRTISADYAEMTHLLRKLCEAKDWCVHSRRLMQRAEYE